MGARQFHLSILEVDLNEDAQSFTAPIALAEHSERSFAFHSRTLLKPLSILKEYHAVDNIAPRQPHNHRGRSRCKLADRIP